MPELKGSKTHENLKSVRRRARPAGATCAAPEGRVEGYGHRCPVPLVAEGETGAFGHFDYLAQAGDPVTDEPVGSTEENLKSAIAGETYEYTEMYPGFARTAREEGFEEIAEWLETLARAEKSHAGRFTQGLESIKS